jgi:hypothetical protein
VLAIARRADGQNASQLLAVEEVRIENHVRACEKAKVVTVPWKMELLGCQVQSHEYHPVECDKEYILIETIE